tara:strand:+ start:151 stop:396 length:246 start_codon:yes stop_codon:yes gene_type:complete
VYCGKLTVNEIDSLKQRIDELEMLLEKERESHKLSIEKVKTENYDALEASQTRYQGELAIQRENFQRQIEKLKSQLQSFQV